MIKLMPSTKGVKTHDKATFRDGKSACDHCQGKPRRTWWTYSDHTACSLRCLRELHWQDLREWAGEERFERER